MFQDTQKIEMKGSAHAMENVSLVRVFTLWGFNETTEQRAALFTLSFLCYCVILVVNTSIILTIVMDRNLHEHMYILLCNLCINGLYGTTGFYPKFLLDLLSPSQVISYTGCLVQAFVMYSFACSDLSILSVMAYDRYLAICRPLEYHSVMTKQRLSQLVCFSWLLPFLFFCINVLLTSRLKLCSPNIQKLLCVNWMVVKLACSPTDTLINNIMSYVTIIFYVLNGFFIIWSYMYLIKVCVKSMESRSRFMQTCVPHLFSLLNVGVALLFDLMDMRFGAGGTSRALRNFLSLEFLVIPPVLNPVIYGFKLSQIRNKVVRLFRPRRKQNVSGAIS